MNCKDKEKEIFLVTDPLSGKHINIYSFFKAIEEEKCAPYGSPDDLGDIVDRAIRYIGSSSRPLDDGHEICDVLFNLYKLLDMFRAMKVIG